MSGGQVPGISPIQDIYAQRASRLQNGFAAWRERSIRINSAAYADSTAGEFYENWSGTSNWSTNTYQVSGGRAYANGGGGSTGGITHAYPLGVNDKARIVIPVSIIPSTASTVTVIGISTDAAGAVPASGAASAKGIYFSSQTINSWNGSALTQLVSGLPANVTHNGNVTITIDLNYISVVFTPYSTSPLYPNEYRCQFPRSGVNVNNLYLYFGDSRSLSGNSVGPLIARKAISTSTPSYGFEASGKNVHYTQTKTLAGVSNNVKIVTPPNYDSRYPSPAVVMFHGNGSNENLFSDNTGQQPVYTAFLNAGYILISSAYSAATSSWGAQNSLDAYDAAVRYARDNYNVGSIGIYANSMGGIESQLCLANATIPGVSWWVGMSPTYNLADCYAPSGNSINFGSTINAAYGVSSYTAIPTGYDPSLLDSRIFRGVPMMILSATDDVSVNPTLNGQLLAQNVAPYAPELVNVAGITGGHSFGLTSYVNSIIAFANRWSSN